jgi:hypothetical protein
MEVPRRLEYGLWVLLIVGLVGVIYAVMVIQDAIKTGTIDCMSFKPLVEKAKTCIVEDGTPVYYCIANSSFGAHEMTYNLRGANASDFEFIKVS